MVQTSIIHLDSYNATLLSDPSNSSGVSKSFYNCQFKLNNSYKNVSKVGIKSLEMPIGFSNIRSGMNELKIYMLGVYYSVYIPVGNYLTIGAIMDAVSNALTNHASGKDFGVLQKGDYFYIFSPLTPNDSWYICDTNFSNLILGIFSTDLPVSLSSGITGSGRWSLNIDNYISLYIPEIGTNGNNNKITFKIPLPVSSSSILYLTENIFFSQSVNCNVSSLNTLTCKFADRFGNDLTAYGYSWSGTVEIMAD